MSTVESWDCAVCGAPLPDLTGKQSVTCAYCDRVLRVSHTRHQTQAMEATSEPTLREQLLVGPASAGEGGARRYPSRSPEGRQAVDLERVAWPIKGSASSTFGFGWSPSALVGPPRVYPRNGDISGAWAPGRRSSRTEWVEVEFPLDVVACAVRVFETHCAGSTYAMTIVDRADREETLYRGPAAFVRGASVLEVAVNPPREIRAIRAYVDNRVGHSWSEIDTIGLVSVSALPGALRSAPARRASPLRSCALVGALLGLALVGLVAWAVGREAAPAFVVEAPTESVRGSDLMRWNVNLATLRERVVWASEAHGASSEYGDGENPVAALLGAPDVFPAHEDSTRAWAPSAQNRGEEWVDVGWGRPIEATAVVWVESFHPGAVVRVDDLSLPSRPVTLWEGSSGTGSAGESVVHSLELSPARSIERIRVVLDTRRAPGWNSIDAVGLFAAQP